MKIPVSLFGHVLRVASVAFILFSAGTALAAAPALRPLKIVIIGDSTVCDYPLEKPDRGWGMFIGEYFNPGVTVVNWARAGRSTKTFIKEGLWNRALAEQVVSMLDRLTKGVKVAERNIMMPVRLIDRNSV